MNVRELITSVGFIDDELIQEAEVPVLLPARLEGIETTRKAHRKRVFVTGAIRASVITGIALAVIAAVIGLIYLIKGVVTIVQNFEALRFEDTEPPEVPTEDPGDKFETVTADPNDGSLLPGWIENDIIVPAYSEYLITNFNGATGLGLAKLTKESDNFESIEIVRQRGKWCLSFQGLSRSERESFYDESGTSLRESFGEVSLATRSMFRRNAVIIEKPTRYLVIGYYFDSIESDTVDAVNGTYIRQNGSDSTKVKPIAYRTGSSTGFIYGLYPLDGILTDTETMPENLTVGWNVVPFIRRDSAGPLVQICAMGFYETERDAYFGMCQMAGVPSEAPESCYTENGFRVDGFSGCTLDIKSYSDTLNVWTKRSEESVLSVGAVRIADNYCIDDGAALGCDYLEEIYLSGKTYQICAEAFTDCGQLRRIWYAGTVSEWHSRVRLIDGDTVTWNEANKGLTVICTDGDIVIDAN